MSKMKAPLEPALKKKNPDKANSKAKGKKAQDDDDDRRKRPMVQVVGGAIVAAAIAISMVAPALMPFFD